MGDNSNKNNNDNNSNNNNSGTDSFNIFSSSPTIPRKRNIFNTNSNLNSTTFPNNNNNDTTGNNADAGNYDDVEGYYRDTIGEIINFSVPRQNDDDNDNSEKKQEDSFIRFKVLGIIGKGVFATVLKCVHVDDPITTNINNGQQSQQTQPPQPPQAVALKLIRNNETMAKAAQKEVRILRILSQQEQQQQPIIDNNVVVSVGKNSGGESDLLPP